MVTFGICFLSLLLLATFVADTVRGVEVPDEVLISEPSFSVAPPSPDGLDPSDEPLLDEGMDTVVLPTFEDQVVGIVARMSRNAVNWTFSTGQFVALGCLVGLLSGAL